MGKKKLPLSDRAADHLAAFGGSWRFLISFILFIVIWVVVNIVWLSDKAFDPYPFILLNLFLSMLASVQAPIIMMAQNRQADRDRKRAERDYEINNRAEKEINLLHEKLDIFMDKLNETEKIDLILEKINEIEVDTTAKATTDKTTKTITKKKKS